MSSLNYNFSVLLEFKYNNSVISNKKQKFDFSTNGLVIKKLASEALIEIDKASIYEISRIMLKDSDFLDELVDLDDNEIIINQEKIFIELTLKELSTILNESIHSHTRSILSSSNSMFNTSSPSTFNSTLTNHLHSPSVTSSFPGAQAITETTNQTQSLEATEIINLIKNNKKTQDVPSASSSEFVLWRQRVIKAIGTLLMSK